jgi:hypothetical protein
VSNAPELPVQLTDGWRLRASAVIAKFEGWHTRLERFQVPLMGVGDDTLREELWRDLMPRGAPEEMKLDPSPYKGDGVFDFGLRRISHYREPGSTRLLAKYSHYLSREAEEYDIGRL